MRIDSSQLLRELGYEYYSYVEPAIAPETVEARFVDIIPELSSLGSSSIAYERLYAHQLRAYEALCAGKNLVLKSGTGSGKTEAWLLYTLSKKIPTLAVYPTLALANDQINRVRKYASATGLSVEVIDALRRDELIKEMGRAGLRSHLSSADLVVTNPAMLLHEVKRLATPRGRPLLEGFLHKAKLLVFDEVDFYGPREMALLLALIEALFSLVKRDYQLVSLTAGIENPEELAGFFTKVSDKPTEIVEGPPFRVENHVYVVLGKDLQSLWKLLREEGRELEEAGVGEDVLRALEDYEAFREQVYRVAEAARALGIPTPSLEPDPTEILSQYVKDSGVTLVFTRSIARAEELARRLKASLPEEQREAVAAHHHLASKEYRALVEEGARAGKVKVLISPRTLSQGIDIGTVVRIVHVGLPESLREFLQREGRKGRRLELGFSETVVLPSGRWDRDLLSRGVESLRSWLQLPVEKVLINPDNKYITMFRALLKFTSPRLRDSLTREEVEFLEELGFVKGGELTARGKEAWRNLGFYDFGPPYGINRVLSTDEGLVYLEGISHCDLVEKFQPGCIDYTSDSIVVEHKIGGRTGRVVTAVVEERLRESTMWGKEALSQVLEEYEEAKHRWGEEPSLFSDYVHGRIHSEVLCAVYPPKKGFGRYAKVPNRVFWRVYSSQPKVLRVGDKTLTYRDFRVIEVPTATYGRYSDYTYGLRLELDPSEDPVLMRIGLALLMIVLRKRMRIPFETIMYDVGKIGEKKYLTLHEPESTGLLEKMDWLEVKKLVEEYQPEELDEALMMSFDDYSYADFVTLGLDWERAKRFALRALDYLLLEQRIFLTLGGVELSVPKPSRALKLASLDALYLPLAEKVSGGLAAVAAFDGEGGMFATAYREFGSVEDSSEVDAIVAELVDRDFSIAVYDFEALSKTLSEAGLRTIELLLKSLKSEGKVVDVKQEVVEALGIDAAPLEEVEKAIGFDRRASVVDVAQEAESSRRRMLVEKPGRWRRYTKFLRDKLREYLLDNCRSMYTLHLALYEYLAKR